ncbi:hypothetical protein ACWM35_12685 [Neobacillus sp. K501]
MDRIIIDFEYHLPLFMYLPKGQDKELSKNGRLRKGKKIVQSVTKKYFDKGPFKDEDALNIVTEIQDKLEAAMKEIISKKSIYYWFHLYRRIGPITSFNETRQTLWLYRNIMEVAFLKHGKFEVSNELIWSTEDSPVPREKIASGNYLKAMERFEKDKSISVKNYGIFLGEFGVKDFIEIYHLEGLAYEYWRTTVCIRRIHKGGNLIVKFHEYYVENDEESNLLMKIYDKRENGVISTTTGIAVSKILDKPMLLSQYNIERVSTKDYPYQIMFGLPLEIEDLIMDKPVPNFIWQPFDFTYYYLSHKCLEDEFEEKFGFTLKGFVYTCYLITSQAIFSSIEQPNAALELMKRSYRHYTSIDEYVDELLDMSQNKDFQEIIPDGININREEIYTILNELTLKEDREHLSLRTLGPRALILPSYKRGNNFIIDYAALLPILLTITHFLNFNETKKGTLFEDYVEGELEDKDFKLWVCQKELKQEDETSKEIDVSFIYKNVLFICECKANKMSLVYNTIGDKKALNHRKKKMVKALNEVDSKADWLIKDIKGTNYSIPEEVEYIIPIVVSPFEEYIWEYSEELWLTSNVPRILLPSEILDLNYEAKIEDIIKRPFVRKL